MRNGNGDADDFVSDIRLMLRFGRKSGIDLTPELDHDIALLDALLTDRGALPVSDIPAELWRAKPTPPGRPSPDAAGESPSRADTAEPEKADATGKEEIAVKPTPNPTELVLRVHAGLSKAVAPATALSLRATEPPARSHALAGGMPMIVKLAAVVALFSAVLYVVSAEFIAHRAPAPTTTKQNPPTGAAGDPAGGLPR